MDKNLINSMFPHDDYRPHQFETIIQIIEAFNKYDNVILEAPTGSGKSAIALTIAKFFGSSFYLTIQKMLMDQLSADYSNIMTPVKGRNSYPCWLVSEFLGTGLTTCDKGLCIKKGKSSLSKCMAKCHYHKALSEASTSAHVLFNFSSFLYQRYMADRFQNRPGLLIIDEAHNLESQIMNFVEISINGNDLEIDIPEYEKARTYISYFESIELLKMVDNKISNIKGELSKFAIDDNNDMDKYDKIIEWAESDESVTNLIKELEKYKGIRSRYNKLLSYSKHVDSVAEYKNNTVTIKPLKANYHTPKLLDIANKKLFMSATILNPTVFSDSIGLENNRTTFIRMPSTFPVENRKIILDYAGSMKYKNRKASMPKMVKKIDTIMSKHKDERGIIHCQSFKMMDDIINGLSKTNSNRLVHQNEFKSKSILLESHNNIKNSVIIAPAMHEGLDLKDDLSRFQIIMKVPYPDSRTNKQLSERVKDDWTYYMWLTTYKLVQSYGRSIRSETDSAITYILDSDFDSFFARADQLRLLPDWFIEAIQLD